VPGNIFDAIVVGSGITGGWAAKELTEKGLETLVLEAGGPVDPSKDYVEHVAPWEVKFRGMGDLRNKKRSSTFSANAMPATSGPVSFSLMISKTRTPRIPESPSYGFAGGR
jgi:choline dehydrogenase-like flavoprotein